MKKTTLLLIALITVSMFGMTGKEVMQKAKDLDRGNTMHAVMGMDLIDKSDNKEARTIEMWGFKYDKKNDLSKAVMIFKKPASVKNTRFLQVENKDRDDDKWIYLPALKRVRRISSSQGSDSFMGSDFSYDDMSSREVDEDTHELLKEEKLGKYECFVVKSTPKKADDSQYKYRISWISKEHFLPIKIEMYDKKDGKLQKLMTAEQNIKKIDNIWTIFKTTMTNLEDNHKTELYVKQGKKGNAFIEYNKKVSSKRFSQRFLKTGK